LTGPFGRRQRFIEHGEGAGGIACALFGLRKRNLDQSVEDPDVLIAQQFHAAARVPQPRAW
jgi:hypothetical protein